MFTLPSDKSFGDLIIFKHKKIDTGISMCRETIEKRHAVTKLSPTTARGLVTDLQFLFFIQSFKIFEFIRPVSIRWTSMTKMDKSSVWQAKLLHIFRSILAPVYTPANWVNSSYRFSIRLVREKLPLSTKKYNLDSFPRSHPYKSIRKPHMSSFFLLKNGSF